MLPLTDMEMFMKTQWVGPLNASDQVSIGSVHFLTIMFFQNSGERRYA
jgi:hypothetical protein